MSQDQPVSGSVAVLRLDERDADSSYSLLLRAKNGDSDACNQLCALYLPRLRRWAHGRLPGWARQHLDTEDIVQDTLMRSVRQLPAFTPNNERAFCAYVSEALRNRLRDVMRRAVTHPAGEQLPPETAGREPSPLEQAVGVQMLGRYDSALQRLRGYDRQLIVARVELGLGYEEIAELLDKPSIPAARVAVSRALVRLASEMGLERNA
jgi:RNA polymerase sigma-70 factor (ECF subfamily)